MEQVSRHFVITTTEVPFIDRSEPKPHDTVFKIGRTTGIATGHLHPTRSLSQMKCPPNATYPQGCIQKTYEHWTIQGAFDKPFIQPGDSGSWVLNEFGHLVGLLWGGIITTETAYYAPITHVIDDIEKATQCKVSLYFM